MVGVRRAGNDSPPLPVPEGRPLLDRTTAVGLSALATLISFFLFPWPANFYSALIFSGFFCTLSLSRGSHAGWRERITPPPRNLGDGGIDIRFTRNSSRLPVVHLQRGQPLRVDEGTVREPVGTGHNSLSRPVPVSPLQGGQPLPVDKRTVREPVGAGHSVFSGHIPVAPLPVHQRPSSASDTEVPERLVSVLAPTKRESVKKR